MNSGDHKRTFIPNSKALPGASIEEKACFVQSTPSLATLLHPESLLSQCSRPRTPLFDKKRSIYKYTKCNGETNGKRHERFQSEMRNSAHLVVNSFNCYGITMTICSCKDCQYTRLLSYLSKILEAFSHSFFLIS